MKKLFLLFLIFLSCNTTKQVATSSASNSSKAKNNSEDEPKTGKTDSPKPKNIILMIGDGMGLTQITAAMYMNQNKLHLERCPTVGLIKTHASDNIITDSAASATAYACGQKTYNGAIGVDKDGKPLQTLLEYAEKQGMATGLVATSAITHATPASFIAHQPKRSMYEAIAKDFLDTDVDLVIGGGRSHFDKRKDKLNLVDSLKNKGYFVTGNFNKINKNIEKFYLFTAPEHPGTKSEGRDYLPQATGLALDFLSRKSDKGFFLVIEGSQIDWGGHANDVQYILDELLDFNQSVGQVLDFAESNGETLVVITADHETGGLSLAPPSHKEYRTKSDTQRIEYNKRYYDALTMKANFDDEMKGDTLFGMFSTGYHTAVMVPVFSFGVGSGDFGGVYENVGVFGRIMEGWKD
ncbi:MAG: alkaline phosphatase [Chitinophagales bacterium]